MYLVSMINVEKMLRYFHKYRDILQINISDQFNVDFSVICATFQTRSKSTFLDSAIIIEGMLGCLQKLQGFNLTSISLKSLMLTFP